MKRHREPPPQARPATPERSDLDEPAVPFLGRRGRARTTLESVFVRAVATGGVVGIGVAIAAILGTQNTGYWLVGLIVSVVSVVFAAILWSSRTL